MTERTAIHKIETKLRLLTAQTFMKLMHKREFRNSFLNGRDWDPTTPIAPALWSTKVGEVKLTTSRHFGNGVRSVIVPVLLKNPIAISVVVLTKDAPDSFWAENFGTIHSDMIMEDVCTVLNPNKDWSTEKLTEVDVEASREFNRLVDMT